MDWERKRILLEALLIVCAGVMLGLSFNFQTIFHAFHMEQVESSPAPQSSSSLPMPADLATARSLLNEGALAVDARIPEEFAAGHLPEARSLPWAEVENYLPDFLSEVSRSRPLLLYCSGFGCTDSFDLGQRLMAEGYQTVYVFEDGFPGWEAAGLPISREAQ